MPGETTIARRPASALENEPSDPEHATVVHYVDSVTGIDGYLAIDGDTNPLAAGGFRVQAGLTAQTTMQLARAMTQKQRLLGLSVDGAKCGLDLDPRDPGKHDAMRRFLRFLRPYLLDRYSMGPDMGTGWAELEDVARAEWMGSVKCAVAKAQGLSEPEFLRRSALLDVELGGATLGQRRAGHGLAHAALTAADWACPAGDAPLRVGIQGFGTLGRAAALGIVEAGLSVTAIADEHGCLYAEGGLPAEALLGAPPGTPLTRLAPSSGALASPPYALLECPVDLLVLAACEDAMSAEQAHRLPDSVRAVVVGANLGLSAEVEGVLHRRAVVVVPDVVGGCGGSASMNALFGPVACPTATEVLHSTGSMMRELVNRLLTISTPHAATLRQAGLAVCAEQRHSAAVRPYGSQA